MRSGWIDAVRRNHGLEHATVAVLLAKHGPMRVAGRASADGFFLLGSVSEEQVDAAAHEALARMQAGEHVGKIVKQWRGWKTELFTDADTFTIEFPTLGSLMRALADTGS